MGLTDVFGKEDRFEITVSQLVVLAKAVAERDVMKRGIVNRVPHKYIETMVFGNDEPEFPQQPSKTSANPVVNKKCPSRKEATP